MGAKEAGGPAPVFEVGDPVADVETGERGEVIGRRFEDPIGDHLYAVKLSDGREACYGDVALRAAE